jgi:glycosyltransferase involved in cell wall biosynthesis
MDDLRDTGPTRVALSMLTLVPGGMGGSERYARSLARELAGVPGMEAVAVVPRSSAGDDWGIASEVVSSVPGTTGTAARIGALARAHRTRRRVAGLHAAHVVHYPFTVPLPRAPGTPYVQTLHDVQHRDLPDMFSRAELAFRRYAYDRGARTADAVMTISEFTKARAVATLGLDPRRVHVAHLGVDLPAEANVRVDKEEMVLYPARAWPHKNHDRLIRAMEIVRRGRPRMKLVLTGGELHRLGSVPSWVERRGHVSDSELEFLYSKATCLAFPSLYEGFGLPPLEAMARACPVAAARAGALPEVCGEAAVLFDPSDPAAIARGIDEAIRRRDELVPAGLSRARRFSWRRCAEAHAQVYRSVVRPAA